MLTFRPLLLTKIFPPGVTTDHVRRDRLLQKLDNDLPLVLVSAPAGFGKSTLVSAWLSESRPDQTNYLQVWMSLEKKDNSYNSMVRLICFAIERHAKGFSEDIIHLINSSNKIPEEEISTILVNKIISLDKNVVLVFDDFHVIRDSQVIELIETFIRFQIKIIKLVIITRSDPPLKLPELRQKGKVCEIRAEDLHFNIDEVKQFLSNNQYSASDLQTKELLKHSEGWASGLRISLLHRKIDILRKSGSSPYAITINEVIDSLKPDERHLLTYVSLSDTFNESLLDFLAEKYSLAIAGEELIYKLSINNMFIIPLDQYGINYRFHHIFSGQLMELLESELDEKSINGIHISIANWNYQNSFYMEAIKHYLKAKETDQALKVFRSYRIELLNITDWVDYNQLVNEFSTLHHPAITLSKFWIGLNQGQTFQVFEKLDQVADEIESSPIDDAWKIQLKAELNAFLAYRNYILNYDNKETLELIKFGLSQIPEDYHYPKGWMWIFKLGIYQIQGRLNQVSSEAHELIQSNIPITVRAQILLTFNYLAWIELDLDKLKAYSEELLKECHHEDYYEGIFSGHYFLSLYHFSIADQEGTYHHMNLAKKYELYGIGIVVFHFKLFEASFLNWQGKFDECDAFLKDYRSHLIKKELDTNVTLLNLHWAQIHVYRQELDRANVLIKDSDDLPEIPLTNFSEARVNKFMVLALSQKNPKLVFKQIEDLENFLKATNHKRFRVELLMIRAIASYGTDDRQSRQDLLLAMQLCLESGLVYPIRDLWPYLEPLYNNLGPWPDSCSALLEKIKGHLDQSEKKSDYTSREIQILELMISGNTNKEIANKLYISEKTVKNHSNRLFRKLGAKNRRQAVQIGHEIGLIPTL